MTFPIKFDKAVKITYYNGYSENSNCFPTSYGLKQCIFEKINGYDSNNYRVTNLVGYDGNSLLKLCPNCKKTKIVTDFGYDGRVTNRKRDQSNCNDCRGRY
ncbi:MAG: hypothetical protein ACTTKD_07265 [Peptoanaerobacter stomatis]|uniref:hypothetical protein n=1 Tax=Peptoanaerobacter stomatis TaxID=796937 RepID=UPI003FA0349E